MLIGILDLLEPLGFDRRVPSKLVRHQDSERYDVHELRRNNCLELYQGFQTRGIFDSCEQIVSFLGDGATKARFMGIYRVKGRRAARSVKLPAKFPYPEWRKDALYFYDLEALPGFEDLQDRVVIEWGRGTRAWVQNLRNKEVIELSPAGRHRDPFVDYQEFILTHDELAQIVRNPEANREWRSRLSAIAGIYLILDSDSGKQYVGSAHGAGGIWGRWKSYASNGHGGNKLLRRLVQKSDRHPGAFRFSVLHILPPTTARPEVLQWEKRYKIKLGSRATGLNLN